MFSFLKKIFTQEPPKPVGPTTFEEAVDLVVSRIDPTTVKDPWFHFTGGRAMRNSLGLWDKESPLYQHMQARFGLCHADDTGALISRAADAKINGTVYNMEVDIERFKNHWRLSGFDPATMQRL